MDVSHPAYRFWHRLWMKFYHPVYRWLWHYLWQDRLLLAVSILCSAGVAVTSIGAITLIQKAISAMEHNKMQDLNWCCVGVVVAYTLRWGFSYGQTVGFAEAGQRLGVRIRQDIYQHLQSLSLSYFNRQRTGALMSIMTNDVPILQTTIGGLKDIAPAPFLIIIGGWHIYHISHTLTYAVVVVVPFMMLLITTVNRQIKQLTARTQNKLSDVTTLMEETLSGMRIIQSFSAEQHEIARFLRENVEAKDLQMKSLRRQAQLKPSIDVIGSAGIALVLWTAGRLVLAHQLDVGLMLGFVGYVNQIAVGITSLGGAKTTFEQVKAAGERITEHVLDIKPEIASAPNAHNLSETEGLVEFEDVWFSYNPDNPVLKGVSFVMNPGEVVAVVGSSGAGKSTLSDLIPRFYDPASGSVKVDGYDLKDLTISSLRSHIAIVPQETMLFGGTIRSNIVYGDQNATDEMVEAAARAANAHHFIVTDLPDGYDTIVGERGKQLSGGQRQRIAIARALLKNPRILILDEATSSLDTRSEELVQKALDELMRGRTTLVIAHRLSTVMNADKILVMQAGRILESGTHRELLQASGTYAQLYETQFRWEAEERPAPAVAS